MIIFKHSKENIENVPTISCLYLYAVLLLGLKVQVSIYPDNSSASVQREVRHVPWHDYTNYSYNYVIISTIM